MKIIIIISLLIFLTTIGFSQIPTDTINFNNVNIKLLTELITKKCDTKRVELGNEPLVYEKITYEAAKYQSECMSKKNLGITHENNTSYNNVLLQTPTDRVGYFNKKYNNDFSFTGEIITLLFLNKETYNSLSDLIIDGFMKSDTHRFIMTKIKSSNNIKRYGAFAVAYNIIDKSFYVTGVFTSKYE